MTGVERGAEALVRHRGSKVATLVFLPLKSKGPEPIRGTGGVYGILNVGGGCGPGGVGRRWTWTILPHIQRRRFPRCHDAHFPKLVRDGVIEDGNVETDFKTGLPANSTVDSP